MRAVIARLLISAGAVMPLVAGCVSSPDENGSVVPPAAGIGQPEAGASGRTVTAAAACIALAGAIAATNLRLGCSVATPKCSAGAGYVAIAGSMPCDEYDQASLNACLAAYETFKACTDFDTMPCVITAVPASCHSPAVTTDSGNLDAAENDGGPALPPEASTDATMMDGNAPRIPDASGDAASADAGADARPSDASPG